MNEITSIPTEDVYPNERHYREVKPASVSALADNISVNGQLYPIIVIADGDIYHLVDGHHRHAAIKKLKLPTIDALVAADLEEADALLRMVAANMHFPETDIEHSRGVQQPLLLGVAPGLVAKSTGESAERVASVARALGIAKDYAEDMSLDRLVALNEFEDDEVACQTIMTTPEKSWRAVYEDLRRAKNIRVATEAAKAIIAEAGCELIGNNDLNKHAYITRSPEAPEGAKYARIYAYQHSGSVDITWYKDIEPEDDEETAEANAKREEEERVTAAFKAAREARLAFVIAYLKGEVPGASNELRDFAVAEWEDGMEADVDRLGDREISGFLARVYASLLIAVDRAVDTLFTCSSYNWDYYVERYGEFTLMYFAALEEAGYKPCPEELEKLKAVKAEVEPRTCRVCGCTDAEACEGGCTWVEDDLCSECVDKCEACKGDGRPFAKDGSRNGNKKCPECGGTGKKPAEETVAPVAIRSRKVPQTDGSFNVYSTTLDKRFPGAEILIGNVADSLQGDALLSEHARAGFPDQETWDAGRVTLRNAVDEEAGDE